MNDYELLRVIDFIEETRAPFAEIMPVADDQPVWNIFTHLIRSEVRGQLVTVSALAQVSGIPYATAMRLIGRLSEQKLVVRTPRGPTGKSHSLHPSESVLRAFRAYARSTKALLARTLGVRGVSEAEDEYYFGGTSMGLEITPPKALQAPRSASEAPLRFLCNNDNYFLALRNMWADLRSNLASTRDFSLQPLPMLHEEVLANAGRAESRFDVVTVNKPWIAELAGKGLILPFDRLDVPERPSLAHFHPLIREAMHWRGEDYAAPIYTTIAILAARRDWFAEHRLDYPKTFDQVIEQARLFHQPANDRFGVVWDGAPGMPIASSFLFFLGACGVPTQLRDDIEKLHARITGDAGLATLDFMRRLLDVSPPDTLHCAWDQTLSTFIAGRAALAFCWSMRAMRMEYDIRSVVKRRVEYLPYPAGPGGTRTAPVGGFAFAIPSNLPPERRGLAASAIAWITSEEAILAHTHHGFPIAPRYLVTAAPETVAATPVLRFVDRLANRRLLSTSQRPNVPDYRRIEEVIGTEIYAAVTRAKSDAAALATIAAATEAALTRGAGERQD